VISFFVLSVCIFVEGNFPRKYILTSKKNSYLGNNVMKDIKPPLLDYN